MFNMGIILLGSCVLPGLLIQRSEIEMKKFKLDTVSKGKLMEHIKNAGWPRYTVEWCHVVYSFIWQAAASCWPEQSWKTWKYCTVHKSKEKIENWAILFLQVALRKTPLFHYESGYWFLLNVYNICLKKKKPTGTTSGRWSMCMSHCCQCVSTPCCLLPKLRVHRTLTDRWEVIVLCQQLVDQS